MSKISETGHVKNVANFERVISYCTGYGSKYDPKQTLIMLPALNTLHTVADNGIEDVSDKKAKFITVTNDRQLVFEPVNPLTTQLINALDAAGETDKIVADARSIGRKIKGERASKKIKFPNPDDPKQISASQMSYDNRLNNFKLLKNILEEEPLYNPNETHLKIATITTLITDLTTKNTAVISKTTDLDNSRIARNHILYDKNKGLYDVQKEVKKYVKSVYGASSSEFKLISGIKFTRLPKKK